MIEIYPLGRIAALDGRDALYPMRFGLGETSPPLVDVDHKTGPILDQGAGAWLNSCVGYAAKQLKVSEPVANLAGLSADDLYRRCLDLDEFPGETDTGTTVRAALKVLQEEQAVANYLWAQSAYDVRDWLIAKGPVIAGTTITEGMMYPKGSSQGDFMLPTGKALGGHAYLLTGYSVSRQAFRVTNSWGSGWSEQGKAWLRFSDFAGLLSSYGEAVGIVETPLELVVVPVVVKEKSMAKLEEFLVTHAATLGATWVNPTSLKDLIEADRIRLAGTDNALLVEIDNDTWTVPDAYRLDQFQ